MGKARCSNSQKNATRNQKPKTNEDLIYKFLIGLVNTRIRVRCDTWGSSYVIGWLRSFDRSCIVITPEGPGGKKLPDALLYTGPGLFIQSEHEIQESGCVG